MALAPEQPIISPSLEYVMVDPKGTVDKAK